MVLILLLLQGCDGSGGEPGRLYSSKDNVDLGASGKETACQCRKCKRHWARSLGREDSLEEGMVTHSSILA